MHFLSCWLFALLSFACVFASPTRTVPRGPPHSSFVTSSSGGLFVNGVPFRFVGTNAYWLPFVNSDDDISKVFADMAADGITVVRLWAFNDVTEIPTEGFYFQLIANGTTTINTGPNGLQRLDKVIEIAAKHNIYVILSLTNNWNPIAKQTSASGSLPPLPRNSLSNDYGGMDAYVREFTKTQTHDLFYTDQDIRKFFENYLQAVITRYASSTTLLGWELANDPRCGSSLASSPSCTTQTITQWHAEIADFISTIDPNHLLTSGNQGFFCPNCPKLFPITTAPPAPAPSPAPGSGRKRSIRRLMNPKTLFQMITKERRSERRASTPRDGVTIRGRWSATSQAKRGAGGVGSSFDGSQGVDSEDILNIPQIGFASFQLFPDQNSYGTVGTAPTPPSANFDETVKQGTAWIQAQAASAQVVGKPVVLTAFGLVSQGNLDFFVPFNSTTTAVTSTHKKRQNPGTVGTGVTNSQLLSAYSTWFQAGLNSGLSGMVQYQFSDQNLTPAAGTVVQNTNGQGSVGTTPNDGYGILGSGQSGVQPILQAASQNFS